MHTGAFSKIYPRHPLVFEPFGPQLSALAMRDGGSILPVCPLSLQSFNRRLNLSPMMFYPKLMTLFRNDYMAKNPLLGTV